MSGREVLALRLGRREFQEGVKALFLPGAVRAGSGCVTTAKPVIATGAGLRTEPVTDYQ